jgi:hypothetical protein
LLVAGFPLLVVPAGLLLLLAIRPARPAGFILLALGFSSLKPPPESAETRLNP